MILVQNRVLKHYHFTISQHTEYMFIQNSRILCKYFFQHINSSIFILLYPFVFRIVHHWGLCKGALHPVVV